MATNTEAAISDADMKRAGTKRGTTKSAATSPDAPRPVARPSKAAKPMSKASAVIKLLSRPKGATGPEIASATDWQPHSVRAYLTGLRKNDHAIVREPRKDGEQAYRLKTPAFIADTSPTSSGGRPQDDGSGEAPAEDLGLGTDDINVPATGAAPVAAV